VVLLLAGDQEPFAGSAPEGLGRVLVAQRAFQQGTVEGGGFDVAEAVRMTETGPAITIHI
jgi:hypothetical protein